MKTLERYGRRAGSALVTVMVVLLISTMFLGTVVGVAMNQKYVAQRLVDRTKAQAIAMAGVNETYNRLLGTNYYTAPCAFSPTNYGDGYYCVTAPWAGTSTTRRVIYSTGHCGIAQGVVVVDLKDYGTTTPGYTSGPPPAVGVFTNLITTGGSLGWAGCGLCNGSRRTIHCNTAFSMNGNATLSNVAVESTVSVDGGNSGAVDFYGSAKAPVITDPKNHIGTKTIGAVPAVTNISTLINLDPYFRWALDHNEVYGPGYKSFPGGDYNPVGGIMWVIGDATLHGTYTGAVICTGSITINAGGKVTGLPGYPALCSTSASIRYAGQAEVSGLIYTPMGDLDMTGGGALTGAIICGGNFNKGGNSSVTLTWINPTPVNPYDYAGTSVVDVDISAWNK